MSSDRVPGAELVFRRPLVCLFGESAAIVAFGLAAIVAPPVDRAAGVVLAALVGALVLLRWVQHRRGRVHIDGPYLTVRSGLLGLCHSRVPLHDVRVEQAQSLTGTVVEVVEGKRVTRVRVSGARFLVWAVAERRRLLAYGIDPRWR